MRPGFPRRGLMVTEQRWAAVPVEIQVLACFMYGPTTRQNEKGVVPAAETTSDMVASSARVQCAACCR
jgi:hypothetical protein